MQVSGERHITNEWDSISERICVERVYEFLDNEEVSITEKELFSDDEVKDIQNSEIVLYDKILLVSDNGITMTTDKISSSEFLNTIGVIDGEMILWFKVFIMDGESNYSYSKLKDDKEIYTQELHFVKYDGIIESYYYHDYFDFSETIVGVYDSLINRNIVFFEIASYEQSKYEHIYLGSDPFMDVSFNYNSTLVSFNDKKESELEVLYMENFTVNNNIKFSYNQTAEGGMDWGYQNNLSISLVDESDRFYNSSSITYEDGRWNVVSESLEIIIE